MQQAAAEAEAQQQAAAAAAQQQAAAAAVADAEAKQKALTDAASDATPDIHPHIQDLMDRRGMTYEQAMAQNTSAINQGGDLDNNGYVTNAEWRQFKNQ